MKFELKLEFDADIAYHSDIATQVLLFYNILKYEPIEEAPSVLANSLFHSLPDLLVTLQGCLESIIDRNKKGIPSDNSDDFAVLKFEDKYEWFIVSQFLDFLKESNDK